MADPAELTCLLTCMLSPHLPLNQQYIDDLSLPKAAHQLEHAGTPPSSSSNSSAQAALALASHTASLRQALQGLLWRGGAANAAAPAGIEGMYLAPAGPTGSLGRAARWLEVQQVEAAANSAMQEQEAEGSP